MSQEEIVESVVTEFRKDPDDELKIGVLELVDFAMIELDLEVTPELLCTAVLDSQNDEADDRLLKIVEAATTLCHQAADRCWGQCLDEDFDEWEEVDICTEWEGVNPDDPEDLIVIVTPG